MISLDELYKFCIEYSSSDQTGFARYNELLKFLENSLQATYGHLLDRASYGQSDQILQTAVENRLSKLDLLKCCIIFER